MFFPITPEMQQALADYLGERLSSTFALDLEELRATYAAQGVALGLAGWDDPAMDAYNDYETRS
ncbi:MAG: hypothetical protein SGJ19_25090 [Planctomycetia bacterium]|nr:hypothetical protein [Planctomycetia bacterium]